MTTTSISQVSMEFRAKGRPSSKELCKGLSVVVQIGKCLWVTNDETIHLERLTLQPQQGKDVYRYGEHASFPIQDYLRLPVPPREGKSKEVDIEGLDYQDGYLWLVGSHNRVRGKPDKNASEEEGRQRLATVSTGGNRFLLARIPYDPETNQPQKEIRRDGKKYTAAQLQGDANGNLLTQALEKDEHLRDFLSIPSKDNGFDIEGLAATGKRLLIGLRGPVLRGYAVILEMEPKDAGDGLLELKKIGPGGQPYRKHFLQLGGLGIRELIAQGDDLLVLAGPTMNLDGPVTLFRWKGGAHPRGERLVRKAELPAILTIPYGQGDDHAEGMTLFSPDEGKPRSLLVVYDAASGNRKAGHSLRGDLFTLPR